MTTNNESQSSAKALDLYARDALLALYHETTTEITRLRQYEWKIGYYFLTLSGGLIAILLDESFQSLLSTQIRIVVTIVQLVSSIFVVYYLVITHNYLTEQRNIRRKVEAALGFHTAGIYTRDTMLPAIWKQPVQNSFQFRNLILPIIAVVLVVQFFSIFVLWKIDGKSKNITSSPKSEVVDSRNDKELEKPVLPEE